MIKASYNDSDCKPCKKVKASKKTNGIWGTVTTILLILLPKCPFCFMAYTSTVVLCGNGMSASSGHTFNLLVTLIIAVVFCCAAVAGILLNFRDKRTWYALLLATAGAFMTVYSVAVAGGLFLYYTGVAIVFAGVWLNGSLLYIAEKISGRRANSEKPLAATTEANG